MPFEKVCPESLCEPSTFKVPGDAGINLRALHMLGKYATMELYPPTLYLPFNRISCPGSTPCLSMTLGQVSVFEQSCEEMMVCAALWISPLRDDILNTV